MTGLFEVLAGVDAEEQERLTGTRAAIAAQTRAKARFDSFLGKANGTADREARLALIDSNLRDLCNEVANEYGCEATISTIVGNSPREDVSVCYLAATAVLGAGHASDCTCGFCENKGNAPWMDNYDDEEGEEKEASVKTACEHCGCDEEDCSCSEENPCGAKGCKFSKEAKLARWQVVADGAQPETGDHYQGERVDLPSSEDGLGEPSPKIDKGNSGDVAGWSTSDIDVNSVRNRLDKQDVSDEAEYNATDFDPSSPLRERQDADKSVSPPDTDRTKTWTGTENQADPVTSSALAKWQVVE
jgi:hypothetical protein